MPKIEKLTNLELEAEIHFGTKINELIDAHNKQKGEGFNITNTYVAGKQKEGECEHNRDVFCNNCSTPIKAGKVVLEEQPLDVVALMGTPDEIECPECLTTPPPTLRERFDKVWEIVSMGGRSFAGKPHKERMFEFVESEVENAYTKGADEMSKHGNFEHLPHPQKEEILTFIDKRKAMGHENDTILESLKAKLRFGDTLE